MSRANQLKAKNRRRLRRKRHTRRRLSGTGETPRLTVTRSGRNISCQVINDSDGVTLTSASTLQKGIREQLKGTGGDHEAAKTVGGVIGERIKALGVSQVRFDRNGYRFHGRVKALVEAAREAGIKI